MITAYHAKYFANEINRKASNEEGVSRLSNSLFDAAVDLNPHQIDAALFALKTPLSKGVILADEVGLGKTIEAGIILGQYWAEKKRNLIIICPAALRKQWATELSEKFNLPSVVLDSKNVRTLKKEGVYDPFKLKKVIIMSYHFAARNEENLVQVPWNLVVIDEAHKLRNAHRESNKMGQAIRRTFDSRKKLLLTATPLQNSLMELYGLSSLIDDHLFGDDKSFKKQYLNSPENHRELKDRLKFFVKRTLRNDVLEYVKYTKRRTITVPFEPSSEEYSLYTDINTFLLNETEYALPTKHKHLTTLIIRKLLASSTYAVAFTLESILKRLEAIKENNPIELDIVEEFIDEHELEDEYSEEVEEDVEEEDKIDIQKLNAEIEVIKSFISRAKYIKVDGKTKEILKAIETGFAEMEKAGAYRKVIIFTESRKTQDYLKEYFDNNGLKGKVVTFSGTNNSSETQEIYKRWLSENTGSDKVTGSAAVDKRTALLDHFKNNAEVMIATEAAAEGVNMQFCSLLINYDLPWNPQRVEQRIGRCHRYGQKYDVVVINFLNKKNQADQRVLELLSEKFNLFNGVFGASDEVLGKIEKGIDFEKKIMGIYQSCRTPEEIEQAFNNLREELEEDIKARMDDTKKALIENFDEDIHSLLKIQLDEARKHLDKISDMFWNVTKFMLDSNASFDDEKYSFVLNSEPTKEIPLGKYTLVNKDKTEDEKGHVYRIGSELGQYVLDRTISLETEVAELNFDISNHPTKISVVEQLKGKSGWLALEKLEITSFEESEKLIFCGLTDDGAFLDQEVCQKMFNCNGNMIGPVSRTNIPKELISNMETSIESAINEASQSANSFFEQERDKLEKWADDKIMSAEQELVDTKAKLRSVKREARVAKSTEEQQALQKEIKELERKQRRQRQKIFDVEDEIMEKRDELIDKLEAEMKQSVSRKEILKIKWNII